jgi:tetratricopeptide (TPR) repeat protein
MSKQLERENAVAEWQELVKTGNSLYTEKRYAQAEMQYAAALRIAEKFAASESLADETPEDQHDLKVRLAKSLNNMAALYHTQGKYSMAEDLLQRCLELKREIHGDRNLEVAINLHNLAALCSARRRYEQAEPLYQESISIREELLGENHSELVPVLQNYALLLRKTHREDEAAEIEERINRIEP